MYDGNYVGLDFETYSDVDLRTEGLDNYVNSPNFRVLVAALHYQKGMTEIIDFVNDEDAMDRLRRQIETRYIIAHNAGFEAAVLAAIGIRRPFNSFIDTAVIARAAGAGGSLEASAAQLLGKDKLATGTELIKLFCIPTAQQVEDGELAFDVSLPEQHATEWAEFQRYCAIDAELCWELAEEYMNDPTIKREIELSALTMKMNDVGWHVDLDLVHAMNEQYHLNLIAARQDFVNLTGADDLNLSSTTQLMAWCKEQGVVARSFDEKSVASLLKRVTARIQKLEQKDVLDPRIAGLQRVKWLLETKQVLGGSSLKKLDVIIKSTSKDGRLRNQYLHVGAGATFRTTGRGVQMQNLKRLHGVGDDVDVVINRQVRWDNDTLAANLRQVFCAADPNGQLIVGDFSSVESRGLAWQAGEEWKISSYFYGFDLYKVQAGEMFRIPADQVTKEQRQIGKVGELACGYGAGPDAVRAFADKMGVELSDAESAKLVKDWRAANPKIVKYWQRLDSLLHQTIEAAQARRIWMKLPHADLAFRTLPAPYSLRKQTGNDRLRSLYIEMYDDEDRLLLTRVIHGAHIVGRNVHYWKPSERKTGDLWSDKFTDPKTKRLRNYTVYGGKLAGLLTQSLCRELFFMALEDIDRRLIAHNIHNVKVVGQFHDEIVLEWAPGTGRSLDDTIKQLNAAMGSSPLRGFPLAAEVKSAHRYIK